MSNEDKGLLDYNHQWTPFEHDLFNLFTQSILSNGIKFSDRLRIVQAMLDTMKSERDKLKLQTGGLNLQ